MKPRRFLRSSPSKQRVLIQLVSIAGASLLVGCATEVGNTGGGGDGVGGDGAEPIARNDVVVTETSVGASV